MANIFAKGTKMAQTGLALLQREVKFPALFTTRYGIADFKGAEGDTVNVKRPTLLRARDKGWRTSNAIVVDNLIKSTIPVALNSHPYSAVNLSPEEATLDEVDYVRDVQVPQVRALLEFFEEYGVAELADADFELTVSYDAATDDPRKVANRARKLFTAKKVPMSGRYWIVGGDVSEAIANYQKLLDVDTSGLPEAVREGVVGRLGGFTIVEVPALDADASYFIHETALAWAVVAPVVPQGAAKGGGVSAGQGLAVTQVWDYDATNMKDRSVVHTFLGVAPVLDPVTYDADGEAPATYRKGEISVTDGVVDMEFVRAIEVTFTPEGS